MTNELLYHLLHINYATILIIFFMITFLFTNVMFEKRITTLFTVAILSALVLVIVDSIESYTAILPHPTTLRILMSAIGYATRPICIMNILLIVVRNHKKQRLLLGIPAAINAVISFSALFTDIAFSYDTNNEFVRGPLGLSAYIVSGIYLLLLVVVTIRYLKERNYYESLVVIAIVITAVLSIFLEVAFLYEGFINATIAVSVTFYYMFFHTQSVKRDPLTQAFNRRCFYADAKRNFPNLKAVISIDLNDLKKINDIQGHSYGDIALCTLVKKIEECMPAGCYLYRTGGDEFMILCYRHEKKALETAIDRFRQEMTKTPYSCAIGMAFIEKDMSFDTACTLADEKMYENKIEMKGSVR